jgi:hypothetical protein
MSQRIERECTPSASANPNRLQFPGAGAVEADAAVGRHQRGGEARADRELHVQQRVVAPPGHAPAQLAV